ncbi:hypothetical protein SAMN04488523_11257 [Sulfitobacter brevis]|uniref:Lipoprotein n=1 Tax=Sulfitobacter brevis TaxID=74348 RepID=A0A1I2EIM1_9RHOB|nr:hypothetical protein [Sulfitobacter brevis]SFE92376.1 hypothetical protein SAMN04488523_11257 [Sulfitobacter brevis]
MTRKTLIAVALISFVSACAGQLGGPPPSPVFGGAYSHSVGFTGIGTEPF